MVFALLRARPAGNRRAIGADSRGPSPEHRFPAAKTWVRKEFAALCNYSGALPRFHAASGAGRNVRAGVRHSTVPLLADSPLIKKTNAGRFRPALRRTTALVPER